MKTKLTRGWIVPCVIAVLVLVSTSACWDPIAGPAIQNGYTEPIVVTATFETGAPLTFELDPGQILWQRPPGLEVIEIKIASPEGATLLVLDESAIRATGLSSEKDILVVSSDGARSSAQP